MVAVALGANWHLTWWLWHVLMVLAFGYVGYSAYVTYRREGATRGLFDAVGTEATLRAVRAEYGSALEQLVAAVARQEAGELTPAEMSLITSGLATRFGLSEGQTAVLGRAAAALRAEREQIERLDVLVAIGHESRVLLGERDLLVGAVQRIVAGFGCDAARIGLLDSGRLVFPPMLASDPRMPVPPNLHQAAVAARPVRRRPRAGGVPAGGEGPARRDTARAPARRLRRPRPGADRLARGPALDGPGERAPVQAARRPLPAVHVARRRHRVDRRSAAGRPRRGGRRGHGGVRRPSRVHHVLRGVDARTDRRDAQPLLRGGHGGDPRRGRHHRAVRRRRADGAVQRPGPPTRPRPARRRGRAAHAGRGSTPSPSRAGRGSGWGSTPGPRSSATSAAPSCATSTRWATP